MTATRDKPRAFIPGIEAGEFDHLVRIGTPPTSGRLRRLSESRSEGVAATTAGACRKSSCSGASMACVEVATHRGRIVMREGDDLGVVVTTTREKLRAFVLGVKAGEFDHLV
ncbi:DUF397 domain-containing protein [Streptomyces sp. BI20]|uniref:DUF397 domain-containing protein n=1 Tax=Streptomyces sp. BI20 TaxID=3403460 RepID=UPI003C795BAF